MYIEKIRLIDWKCFRDVELEFPPPDEKPIVLIGGENGAGKTSLLEGLLVGLYGRQAMGLISEREINQSSGDRTYYNQMIRNSVNQAAIEAARHSKAKIIVVFRDEDERIKIQRVFHLRNGRSEEELTVWQGAEPDEWQLIDAQDDPDGHTLQDFIESEILHHDLARFFFFDGEQIQRLASRDRSDIIRNGLEQLFGLRVLRTLQLDLKTLGAERRKEASQAGDRPRLEEIERQINTIEGRIHHIENDIRENTAEMADLQKKREKLQGKIEGALNGNDRNIKDIDTDVGALEQRKKEIETRFDELLSGSLALALAHSTTIDLQEQLEAEDRRDNWEATRASIGDTRKRLEDNLRRISEPRVEPEPTEAQWNAIRERIGRAYEGLFDPPPVEIAEHKRLRHIGKEMRGLVAARLAEVRGLASGELVGSLDELEKIATQRQRKEEDREALREGSPVKKWMSENSEKTEAIGRLQQQVEDLQKTLNALQAELQTKKSERGQIQGSVDEPDIQGKVADACMNIREMLDKFIVDLVAMRNRQVSDEMTKIYKTLARKVGVVDRIFIDDHGGVSFFGEGERNFGDQEFSAGEKEIFALSWLAAAGKVGGSNMPIMIDTPMARLDATHRMNICSDYFPNAAPQVILLSTNSEIVGKYHEAIEPYISEYFVLRFNNDTESSEVISKQYFLENGEDSLDATC